MKRPTVEEIQEMDESGVLGFCTTCGEIDHGAEPDAEEYDCPSCGAKGTFHGPMYFLFRGEVQ